MTGKWLNDDYSLKRKPGTKGVWRVASPLSYETGDGITITVLPGWDTDGTSIPRFLRWWASPFTGRYVAAAIVHDALYRGQHPTITRKMADDIFKESMVVSGTRESKAVAIWFGVRMGGWLPWRNNAPCADAFRLKYLSVQGVYEPTRSET